MESGTVHKGCDIEGNPCNFNYLENVRFNFKQLINNDSNYYDCKFYSIVDDYRIKKMSLYFIEKLRQHYNIVCRNDSECLQLQDRIIKLFQSSCYYENDEFQSINMLVNRIIERLSIAAVISVWIICCQSVVKKWASCLPNYKDDNLLDYLLYCWFQFQHSINSFYAMTISIQRLTYRLVKHHTIDLLMSMFVENFIINHQDILFESIWREIQNQKQNSNQQNNRVEQIFQLMKYIDGHCKNPIIYYRCFGFPYLKRLKSVYRNVSNKLINDDLAIDQFDLIGYFRFVKSAINDELALAKHYSFSLDLIKMEAKLLYSELIGQYQDVICDFNRFQQWIDSERWLDLQNLFNMIRFNENILKKLAKNFGEFVRLKLSTSIKLSDWKSNHYNWQLTFDFVHDCHQLFRYCYNIIEKVFENETTIYRSLNDAYLYYLNSNNAFACIISLLIHFASIINLDDPTILIDGNQQTLIKSAFDLLMFIEDKSAIIYYNRRFLCQRILFGLSNCSMLQDIERIANFFDIIINPYSPLSFNVKILLNDYLKSHHSVGDEIEIFLLNSSLWNLDRLQLERTFRIPNEFITIYQSFIEQFLQKNPKKILTLQPIYCSALVQYINSENCEFHFIVTLKQMTILSIFNEFDMCSYKQLEETTELKSDQLKSSLEVFIKYKLLLILNTINDHVTTDLSCQTFIFNDHFKGIEIMKSENHLNLINWIKLEQLSLSYDIEKILSLYETVSNATNSSKHFDGGNRIMDKYLVIEATIIRTLKWMVCVANLETLQQNIRLKLAYTPYESIVLDTDEFRNIINSLQERGYLHCMEDGRIVYEP